MVDDKGQLNHEGYLELKDLFENTNTCNKENGISSVNEKLVHINEDEVRIELENEDVQRIQEIELQLRRFQEDITQRESKSISNFSRVETEEGKVIAAKWRFILLLSIFVICGITYLSVGLVVGKGSDNVFKDTNSPYYPDDSQKPNNDNSIGMIFYDESSKEENKPEKEKNKDKEDDNNVIMDSNNGNNLR